MPHIQETHVSSMKIREKRNASRVQRAAPQIEWQEADQKPPGDRWLRNFAVAAALVLCAVTLRTGALPALTGATDVVLTAATDSSLLDDQLGKLSFVSALFPEAVLVFGETAREQLSVPVSGGVVIHAWSEAEPYTTWRSSSLEVVSAAEGEVIGIYHGNDSERLVQVMGDNGLACLYGNLQEVCVEIGTAVKAGDKLGVLMPGRDCAFEVRQQGVSMDPALYLSK